ncbi:hypothetical protein TNCV_2290991 [Trichonephila clavipes]|uniref:Uncharacterized protein n=1 Tax=Trichonephila clavipes TaxID=2585209 RepID=A0A8X6UX74_TRICX|nr:hypothetical protein TNCV_2290991 [Trichonephila clavipes]
MNLKPTHGLNLFAAESRAIVRIYINTRTQSRSAFGEKFVSTAGIAVIAVLPYSGSERVKRHHALPLKTSWASAFNKYVSFSMRALCVSKDSHPKMSWRSTDQSRMA